MGKAYYLKDTGKYLIKGLQEGLYLLNGMGVEVKYNEPILVDKIESVVRVSETLFASVYVNNKGEEMSSDQYLDMMFNIKKGIGKYEGLDTLDLEYHLKRLENDWKPIMNSIPHKKEVEITIIGEVVFDTGNEFITPLQSVLIDRKVSDELMYFYDRASAVKKLALDKLKTLGYKEIKISSFSDTKKEMNYGWHINDSRLGSLAFCNAYPFSNTEFSDVRGKKVLTLEQAMEHYDKDKKAIEKLILEKHLISFGVFKNDTDRMKSTYKSLENLEAKLNTLRVHKVDESKLRDSLVKVRELKTNLLTFFDFKDE